MGWRRGGLCLFLLLLLLSLPLPGSASFINFLEAPPPFSASSSAAFRFQIAEEGRNGDLCGNCSVSCKLDNYYSSGCKSREATFTGLLDGNHILEICINGSQRVPCAVYNWTIDTMPPTAYVSAATFTNTLVTPVRVSFSEPCAGGGGFRCSNDECDLLVYGPGHIVFSTFKVLQPDLDFSLMVAIDDNISFGRLILVMAKSFCTDAAGNRFKRTSNSTFILHFDRRNVNMNLTAHVQQKQLLLNGEIRTVEATNRRKNLIVHLSFSEPVLNSSEEILNVIHVNNGFLIPTKRNTFGNRRFGYIMQNLPSVAVVTLTCNTAYIISRQGTAVSPADPVSFLYDTLRPSVRLSAISSKRTRESTIPVLAKFVKPVMDFNSSALRISGGHLLSFREISKSIYTFELRANGSTLSIEVPENATADVAGNKNLPSNHLQVRHYSVPTIASSLSHVATISLTITSSVAALITVSTASLLSSGAFSRWPGYFISEPSRNLLRITCHIQIFALSRWLPVTMPIEFYEFAKGIQWSIPYIHLPWESSLTNPYAGYLSSPHSTYSELWERNKLGNFGSLPMTSHTLDLEPSMSGKPLTPMEYMLFFEYPDMKPEAEYTMVSRNSDRWKEFGRNMFWLAIIGGGLILLHALFLLIIKMRRKISEKQREFGALAFPRFEIFLVLLALPCICQASAAIIKGKATPEVIVGIILIGICTSFLISLLLFLSLGITMGKLLQYKEVHQEGQEFHWYQELIRVTLGPGKRGQWTWICKTDQNSSNLTKLGPLFEDLRGPPKYMLTQIAGSRARGKHEDRIIASEDENEDAEAPFIQKLFGILRIYYTFLESVRRVTLGIIAGAYSSGRPSKVPVYVMLSITFFQLFFMVLKKPFIKKRVQFVEIITVAGEVGLFGSCVFLLEKDLSDAGEKGVGYFMLAMFLVGFVAEMVNEWYALYQQILRLSQSGNSFNSGLKTALSGLLLLQTAKTLTDFKEQQQPPSGVGSAAVSTTDFQVAGSSGMSERSWLRQLRELAKASFSREDVGVPNDPSTSTYQKSGLWGGNRSGSSSMTSSADFKAKGDLKTKSKGLYKDLEAIFSSS